MLFDSWRCLVMFGVSLIGFLYYDSIIFYEYSERKKCTIPLAAAGDRQSSTFYAETTVSSRPNIVLAGQTRQEDKGEHTTP